MNSWVVLVAFAANLVHAVPSYWANVPAHPGAAHPGPAHPGPAHPGPAHVATPTWHGPLATPVVLHSGFLADTPEVAALKAKHTAPAYHSSHYEGYSPAPAHYPEAKWRGSLAIPVVLPSGFLADTPEVAALKSAHLAKLGGHGHYYH